MTRLFPSPQDTEIPSFPAERIVPGAFAVSPPTWARNTFQRVPATSVVAQGQGISPRTWLTSVCAGFVQSMGDISRESMEAY